MERQEKLAIAIGFGCGWLTAFLFIAATNNYIDPIVVNKYAILKQHKVPVVLTQDGKFYLYNEQTKTSVKITSIEVINMSSKMENQ